MNKLKVILQFSMRGHQVHSTSDVLLHASCFLCLSHQTVACIILIPFFYQIL